MKEYKAQIYVTKEKQKEDETISGYIGDIFYCISKGKSTQFKTNMLVYHYTLSSPRFISLGGEFFTIDDAINHLNNELNRRFNSMPIEEINKEAKRRKELDSLINGDNNDYFFSGKF